MTNIDLTAAAEAESPSTLAPANTKPVKLQLKEIRIALGENYKPIITVAEAASLSRLAVKTLQKKVSEGYFKQSVKRGRPLLFWTDKFVQELMR